MKRLIAALILCTFSMSFSQVTNLNLDLYKSFLHSHQNLTFAQLSSDYPAGKFLSKISSDTKWKSAGYIDSIELKLGLTEYEKELLAKHGFVVTERLKMESFGSQFQRIYNNDLPVFISSDAILYAFHSSYDKLLKKLELTIIIPKLKNLLGTLHNNVPSFANKYSDIPEMQKYLQDLDFYITIPLKLFNSSVSPAYTSNTEVANKYYNYVFDEQIRFDNFLSESVRKMDFSQFKPRGHYTDELFPELQSYFRAMMWLGRMELYLIAPVESQKIPLTDEQRQAVVSYLLQELIDFSDMRKEVDDIEEIISLFVGEQDNVTLTNLDHLKSLLPEMNNSAYLLDTLNFRKLQDKLKQQPYSDQKILSQVLLKDPSQTEDLKPASSFMLFGQRFVIDSYVTANVVFDKIKFNGVDIFRALPSLLDVMFAIGNNATLQLLKAELEQYQYSTNLSSLRYLIDNYTNEFWEANIYSNWLNGIRSLNPPSDRTNIPEFMQTAAWWQEKLNTQLASWTELRHDNLLYAKQSYTGGTTCSYPYGYVEPIPEFYSAMKTLAKVCSSKVSQISIDENEKQNLIYYFNYFFNVNDTLLSIANKELSGTNLSSSEIKFLKNVLTYDYMCGINYNGWYSRLFYEAWDEAGGLLKKDYLVADYHTAPTDEAGNTVGWVKHAGTGPVDLAIVIAKSHDGNDVAFVGPVMSFYEYTTTNFLRLTDEEWKSNFLGSSTRPSFVNLYLADSSGNSRGNGTNLIMSNDDKTIQPNDFELKAINYPNPFNPSTIISFNIPNGLADKKVELNIINIEGELVKKLINEKLPAGNYLIRWDGTNQNGKLSASGIYFYKINIGQKQFVGKMNLIK